MLPECDLIMKGGITSGVVYPHAIVKVADKYRLRSIGGTSAGAIAAAFAAAAEYRRQEDASTAGFNQIGDVAEELGSNLLGLFQPTPATRPLFQLLLAAVDGDAESGLSAALRAVPRAFFGQVVVGAGLALVSVGVGIAVGNWALSVLGVVLSTLLSVILIARSAGRMFGVELPKQDFGLCTGKTQAGFDGLAFGDWIAEKIDAIAGKTEGPLTVGDLRRHKIELAAMTTDLSSKRPYRLPLATRIHYFSEAEIRRLFPDRIVDYLCQTGQPRAPRATDPADLPNDLYQLPTGDAFPVYLVARMSLSFPGLISGVPLWRIDYTSRQEPFRRCLFSDGGISSNFPIHFFDSFLPSRPTFGIALDAFDPTTHEDRIHLPTSAGQSTAMPIASITSVSGFLMAIYCSAKDWQDKMQSMLPGYAERIVSIRLDERREGGLNLAMGEDTIKLLTNLGADAGARLMSDFEMDNHRLHRARSLLPTLEGALDEMSQAYDDKYAEVLAEHDVKAGTKGWRKDTFAAFAAALATLGTQAREAHEDPGRKSVRQGDVQSADTEVRLVPTEDRVPLGRDEEA